MASLTPSGMAAAKASMSAKNVLMEKAALAGGECG
jgi:hypothetical protein